MRLIKPVNMKQMPWKNGGGVTSEVAISPETAEVGKLDFDWRVSIATVSSNGPFSLFPGYDRQLVVWKGEGLLTNEVERLSMQPFEFSGELNIDARLMSGPVQDFGVIYRRGRVQSKMACHSLQEGDVAKFDATSDCFVLCAQGELRVGEFYLNPGDVVHATGTAQIAVTTLEASKFVVIQISEFSQKNHSSRTPAQRSGS